VKKLKPIPLLLGAIGLAIGLVGISALREATLSVHDKPAPAAVEVVLHAKTKGAERGQTLDEMVEAKLLSCRLEVTSDLSGSLAHEPESTGRGRYRVVMKPGLDDTNRKQFTGCVEDWSIDHIQMSVIELNDVVG